jgi:hypothetical protein
MIPHCRPTVATSRFTEHDAYYTYYVYVGLILSLRQFGCVSVIAPVKVAPEGHAFTIAPV